MLVQTLPDTMTKFAQMGDATIYEPAGDQPQAERRLGECITNVSTPTGKRPILKTMLTTSRPRSKKCFYRSGQSVAAIAYRSNLMRHALVVPF